MSETAVEIPGYVAGTWTIDPVHSEVSFVVRHMMVSKVRGRFDKFEGTIVTAPDPLQSSVTATVELSSVNTGEPNRDNHIRSADFFEVESHPHLTFRSTGVRPDGDDFLLDGDLTIRGTTKPVTLKLEVNGFGRTPSAGPGRASRPAARSTGTTSASATTARSPAAASPSARRSRSPSRSRASWQARVRHTACAGRGPLASPGPRSFSRGPNGLGHPPRLSRRRRAFLGSRGRAGAAPRPRRPLRSRSRRRAARRDG